MLGGIGYVGPTTPEQPAAFFTGYGPHPSSTTTPSTYYRPYAPTKTSPAGPTSLTGPDNAEALDIVKGILSN